MRMRGGKAELGDHSAMLGVFRTNVETRQVFMTLIKNAR